MSGERPKPGPLKVGVAVVSIAGAIATVAFHLGLFGVEPAADAATFDDGPRPIPLALDAIGEGTGLDEIVQAADARGEPEDGEPGAEVVVGSATPDWRGMFERLMEREEARRTAIDEVVETPEDDETEQALREAEEAARAEAARRQRADSATAGLGLLVLRGTFSVAGEGVALVDGHLVRVGDLVPGTVAAVTEIHRDHIVLRHPDVDGAVSVPLAPLDVPSADDLPETEPPAAPEPAAAPPAAPSDGT